MEWDCDDCSSLLSRRNSASQVGEPTASTSPLTTSTSIAAIALNSRPADVLTPRPAVKRPRSGDFSSSSEESSDGEREVDVLSISDQESSVNSSTSQFSKKRFDGLV